MIHGVNYGRPAQETSKKKPFFFFFGESEKQKAPGWLNTV